MWLGEDEGPACRAKEMTSKVRLYKAEMCLLI